MSNGYDSPPVGGSDAWEGYNTGRDLGQLYDEAEAVRRQLAEEEEAKASLEQAEAIEVYDRHREVIESFFEVNPEAAWVILGDNSGEVIISGSDSELLSERQVRNLGRQLDENLHVFGKPVQFEPTHPDPNVPPAR